MSKTVKLILKGLGYLLIMLGGGVAGSIFGLDYYIDKITHIVHTK